MILLLRSPKSLKLFISHQFVLLYVEPVRVILFRKGIFYNHKHWLDIIPFCCLSCESVIPLISPSWQIVKTFRFFTNAIIPSVTIQVVINFTQLFCRKIDYFSKHVFEFAHCSPLYSSRKYSIGTSKYFARIINLSAFGTYTPFFQLDSVAVEIPVSFDT